MRKMTLALCLLLASVSCYALADPAAAIKMEHPGDAALSEESPGKFVYKSFPALTRLYVYDKDPPGRSACDEGCSSAWPPLLVSAVETKGRIGDWTVIQRAGGAKQWAYKNKPVYTRFHDMAPDADTEKEGFHLLKP
jgi:predicted lipoprotein with Yx(FWY)xxD motif